VTHPSAPKAQKAPTSASKKSATASPGAPATASTLPHILRLWLSLEPAWRYTSLTATILAILYTVGTAGHLYRPTLPLLLAMTPGFLALCGAAVIAPAILRGGRRAAITAAALYLVTFGLEALGVATGLVFGPYHYGPTLGPGALGVPFVIAFNWVIVVYGATVLASWAVGALRQRGGQGSLHQAERRAKRGTRGSQNAVLPRKDPRTFIGNLIVSILAGILATVFDWIMEPVAIHLDYWQWTGGDIPFQNYAAWFLIATMAAFLLIQTGQVGMRTGPFHSGSGATKAQRRHHETPSALHPGRLQSQDSLVAFYVIAQALYFIILRAGWVLGV
jgi:putative membrane protein